MKKLLILLMVSTFLVSCNQSDNVKNHSKETHKEQKKQKIKKKKHEVKKVDGVTYIDNHIFVNKKVHLPKDYAPGENKKAREHLNKLIEDGRNVGKDLVLRSGYRSYENQAQLFKEYVQRDGEKAANRYSAKPGESEHQTGLTFDVGSDKATNDFRESFGKTEEGEWIANNAHKYGFIIRYPEGKENITGYQYEAWHLRYLGRDLATKIKNKNITLEEYFEYGK